MRFFSDGSSGGGSKLKIRAMEKIGTLNESNNALPEYLTTDYVLEILVKNKMKIHLEAGNIYYNNINISSRTKQKTLWTMKFIFQTTLTFI